MRGLRIRERRDCSIWDFRVDDTLKESFHVLELAIGMYMIDWGGCAESYSVLGSFCNESSVVLSRQVLTVPIDSAHCCQPNVAAQ